MEYNLDENEEIDNIKINWINYDVWDIPLTILEEILEIKTGLFSKSLMNQWKPICKKILEIRNNNINIDNLTEKKLLAFIQYIKNKISKWQLW